MGSAFEPGHLGDSIGKIPFRFLFPTIVVPWKVYRIS